MKITALKSFKHGKAQLKKGESFEVPEPHAKQFIENGWAQEAEEGAAARRIDATEFQPDAQETQEVVTEEIEIPDDVQDPNAVSDTSLPANPVQVDPNPVDPTTEERHPLNQESTAKKLDVQDSNHKNKSK